VAGGEALPDLVKDPTMPGERALDRWRRRQPEFKAGLKAAHLMGHRRRMAAQSACTPALTQAIVAHILRGGSLHSAARAVRGAPHHVTLYGWMRRRPAFAQEIAWACVARDERLLDLGLIMAGAASPGAAAGDQGRLAALRKRVGQLRGGHRRASAAPQTNGQSACLASHSVIVN